MRVFWELKDFFYSRWQQYLIAVFLLTLVAGLLMVPPKLIGGIVDQITRDSLTAETLWESAGLLFVLALVIYVLRVLWRLFLFGASHQLAAETRQQLFEHWLTLPPAYFHRNRLGDLMAHATNDVEALQMTAGEGILAAFDGLLTGLLVLAVMTLTISWELTLAALLPWPVAAIFMYRFGRQLHDGFSTAQASFGTLTDSAQEAVAGIRTIKSYGQEAAIQSRYDDAAQRSSQAYLKVAATDAKYHPTIGITIGLSFLMALVMGGWMISQQRLTLGELTSFTMYLGYMIWPMFAFGWMLNIAERGSAALIRIRSLLAITPDFEDKGRNRFPGSADLKLDLRSFGYDTSPPVLGNLHIDVPAGTILGITGPTGAGKTTLLKLLMRQYDTDHAVFWGSVPVSQISLQELRSHIAYVPQEPFLFSTSIRENLLLGHQQATEKELLDVIRVAALAEDIEQFPDGLDTLVGERGVTLSGGQKQRLSLARALLQKASVLILDDALSAVDTGTERQILSHLQAHFADTTTIIVSHRLSALMQAEQILVLQQGEIAERGTHQELLRKNGWYARIHALQQLESRLDGAG